MYGIDIEAAATEKVREVIKELKDLVNNIRKLNKPEESQRCLALCVTKLEECEMWFNRQIEESK